MYRTIGLFLILGIGVAIVLVLQPWLSQGQTAQPLQVQPGTVQTQIAAEPPPAPGALPLTHTETPLLRGGWSPPKRLGAAAAGSEALAPEPAPPHAVKDSLGALLRRLQGMSLDDRHRFVQEELVGALVRWDLRVVAVHEKLDASGQSLFQVILEDPGYKRAHSVWCEPGPEAAGQARGLREGGHVTVSGAILDMTPRSLVIRDCRLNEALEPEE